LLSQILVSFLAWAKVALIDQIFSQEMHALVLRGRPMLNVSGFFLQQNLVTTPKVAEILWQRYPECRAASKVFNKPCLKMAL
jgi:hypothetical protein